MPARWQKCHLTFALELLIPIIWTLDNTRLQRFSDGSNYSIKSHQRDAPACAGWPCVEPFHLLKIHHEARYENGWHPGNIEFIRATVLTICFTRKDVRLREIGDQTNITVIKGKEYLQVEHDIESILTCGSIVIHAHGAGCESELQHIHRQHNPIKADVMNHYDWKIRFLTWSIECHLGGANQITLAEYDSARRVMQQQFYR